MGRTVVYFPEDDPRRGLVMSVLYYSDSGKTNLVCTRWYRYIPDIIGDCKSFRLFHTVTDWEDERED